MMLEYHLQEIKEVHDDAYLRRPTEIWSSKYG